MKLTNVRWNQTCEYHAWEAMKQRCSNPNYAFYHNYGGRGIAVCDRWLHCFENFLADMGPRPDGRQSLDRVNNDGNYEPGNCRWATWSEQMHNRRPPRGGITIDGETKSITQWAAHFGLSRGLCYRRRHEGWPMERWFEPVFTRRESSNTTR